MSEEKNKTESMSEEDLQMLKSGVHGQVSASLSFIELVNIMNNIIAQEVESRLDKMSEEEKKSTLSEIKDHFKKMEEELAEEQN